MNLDRYYYRADVYGQLSTRSIDLCADHADLVRADGVDIRRGHSAAPVRCSHCLDGVTSLGATGVFL